MSYSSPQMLFPDPRFRSPTALGGFGLTFACDDVTNAMSRLQNDLAQAQAAGLLTVNLLSADTGHPTAVAAQATYDSINNGNLVIESSDACAQYAAQANAAADSVESLLSAKNTSDPNYVPPTNNPYSNPSGTPTILNTLSTLQPYLIAGAVGLGLILLYPFIAELAGWSKIARAAKKRTS